MKSFWRFTLFSSCAALLFGADPALTIYNQNFAVIRETLPLDLKADNNTVNFDGATAQVEPDSVILRDPSGGRCRCSNRTIATISQERLLSRYEGKSIDFAVFNNGGTTSFVNGKIIRSGYQQSQPVIEVNGKLQFSLPGELHFRRPELDKRLQHHRA